VTVNAVMFVPPIDSAEARLTPLEKTPNIATLPALGPFRDNATVYVPRGGSVIHPRPDHRAANTSILARRRQARESNCSCRRLEARLDDTTCRSRAGNR